MTQYVTTTGIHKSGNSWLVAMLYQLFAGKTTTRFSLNRFLCLHDLVSAIRSCPDPEIQSSPQDLAFRLLNPTESNRLFVEGLSSDCLKHLAKRVRWNMARANQVDFLSIEQIESELEKLFFHSDFEMDSRDLRFIPSKHMPLNNLFKQFDRFKRIWLIRDPRDALVSYFFHDMGVLTQEKLAWFVTRNANGEFEPLAGWRSSFLQDRVTRQLQFYAMSYCEKQVRIGAGSVDPQTIVIRYEDLLQSPHLQLASIVEFLSCDNFNRKIDEVIAANQFKKLAGSTNEQKDSFVRKGVAGEWKKYFQRSDAKTFTPEYCDLLVRLGYESNRDWLDQLPAVAKHRLELERFRLRSSAIYNSMDYWIESTILPEQFPRPFDFDGDGSFFSHLRNSNDPAIRNWFDGVSAVFDMTRELDKRHDADQLLGY